MSSFLEYLPDELLQQILQYVPPEDVLRGFSPLCRRLHRIAEEPLLWRYYCNSTFKYWNAVHRFQSKIRGPVHRVNWKRGFLMRLGRNAHAAALLDGIVQSRVSRLQKMEQICQYGYDVKDFLLSQCRVDDSVEDVLARRHFACTVLDSIHRGLAVEEWTKYQKHAARQIDEGAPTSERIPCGMKLERALGAFDMFMLHENEGDLDEITELVDQIASRFREDYPYFHRFTTRQKAVALCSWLQSNNMAGLSDPDYRYLRNCLIGRTLRDNQHPSLPIISIALYASIASRLNLEAYCCLLTRHVYAIVLSPPGISLDGERLPEDEAKEQEKMFLDPFRSNDEVPVEHIHDFLARLGASAARDKLLNPTSTDLVVLHTARNLRASFTSFRNIEHPLSQSHSNPMMELHRADWARNFKPALYSMLWASIMMVPILPDDEHGRWDWQQDVGDLLRYFHENFPEDSWIIEKYVCPMYDTFAGPLSRRYGGQNVGEVLSKRVRDMIREIRRVDSIVKEPRRRSQLKRGRVVRYRVGQIFKHRRYHYHGIILGWKVGGASSSTGWDDRSGWSQGTYSQPFYRCMNGSDGSYQHVIAEENIEVVDLRGSIEMLPPDIKNFLPIAGKFFKRWDAEQGVFISNLKELFPED